MPEVAQLIAEVATAARMLPTSADAFDVLSDDELMDVTRTLAGIEQSAAASAALAAGAIARRSRPELGYAGLAQRTGARTPEGLVQQLTGSTGREAATRVRVGTVMHEAELTVVPAEPPAGVDGATAPAPETPWDGTGTAWLAPVGRAVAAGGLSVEAADAIRFGLGSPGETITMRQLTDAAHRLVEEAALLNADQLLKRAKNLRDEVDQAGVAERERARHEARYFKISKRRDNVVVGSFALPAESGGAELLETFQSITSPRRGGPRFVDEVGIARAKRITDDPRTDDQLRADGFVELVRLGVDADPGTLVGSKKPAVRVLITERNVKQHTGTGRIEGHSDAISIETVERNICDTGIVPILFDDDGQCINLGREQRLFTRRQRIALAARDGGCRFPGCDQPPSWCEAHHLDHWERDDGCTDIADGILLCRHHHMLLHNNHWQIQRTGGRYFLIPPRERDPQQTPIEMPSKSDALADLYRRKRAS